MPVLSKFHGIIIKMYFRQKEHNLPHIHAIYRDCIGLFSLDDAEMYEGDIPVKEQKMIKNFIQHYRNQLFTMWNTQKFCVLPPLE